MKPTCLAPAPSAPPAHDDLDLVNAAREGDENAFRQLVDRHRSRIYRFLLKHAISAAEAEELTQDVFLQAYLGLNTFRGESRFLSWLTGIALNRVRNFTSRSPWRLLETDIEQISADDEPAAFHGDPERSATQAAALNALAIGIGQLSDAARESLILVTMEDMPYEEVAELLNEPVGSIKSRVSRARKQLREHMQPHHLELLAQRSARTC